MTTDGTAQPDARATGFRTFLIADVRGYTTFTRERGDEAAAALAATFAATVREVVEARDGFLLELRGDEALVVFESPRQALRAAVGLQERLKEVGLPRGVGIGLDAGEAVPVEGGYRGGALNLAARLCSQAKAGEILASETVIHLAARIEGVEYVDPRMLRLKGYAEPIRAVEVVGADRVQRGLARRVRRVRYRLWSNRRLALVAAVALAASALAVVIAIRPPPPAANPLADLPPGVALLDAATGNVIAHIPTSTIKSPVGLLYANGKFWVANMDPPSLVEVDAKTGQIGRLIALAPQDGGAAIDGDTLWVTDFEHPVIAKIDLPSGREVERFDLGAQLQDDAPDGFSDVSVGDGSLWLAGKDRGAVFRVNPTNGKIEAEVHNVSSWVVAAGQDAVWTEASGGLDRIDIATNSVTHTDVPGGAGLGGGLTTDAGFGWTANESKGVVYKVDAGGNVAATYATGLGAKSVWFSDGVVWVGNQDEGTVTAIDVITGDLRALTFGHPVGVLAAGSGSVAVVLGEGKSYEDRINELQGKVARLFIEGYQFDTGDPAIRLSPAADMIEQATCSNLLNYTKAGELQPEIATAMPTVSDAGRTYTFKVQDGFAFSEPSGEPVTAETFRYSIERALSPRLDEGGEGLPAQLLNNIAGEQAFRDGKADHISGLVADGETLTITLDAPSGDFLARLALPLFCPVPINTPILRGAASQRSSTPAGFVDQVPSTGPYYVADHLNGEYVILKRNPNYGGKRTAAFDAIALREGINGGVAVSRVQSGDWDGIVGVNDQVFDLAGELATRWGPGSAAAANGDQRYQAVPDGGILYVAFNASRPPFSDVRLRQAVSLALDRTLLAATWTSEGGSALPWDSVLAPPMRPSQPHAPGAFEPDVDAARGLAATAPKAPVRLVFDSWCDECRRAADRLVVDLAAIGLDVATEGVDNSFELIHEPGSPYDMKIGRTWPFTPDAAMFITQLLREEIPVEWLPASLAGATRDLAAVQTADRVSAAIALADGALAKEVPVAVYGYVVHGAFFAPTLGCIQFIALRNLDLVALCPKR